MRFYFKAFMSLLSVTGVLLTLYVVYSLQFAPVKPAWLLSYRNKVMAEVETQSLKRKSYIEKIQNCMDGAKVCEEKPGEETSLTCDKGKFSMFFRCAGFKKDEREVVPVESDYH